MAKFIGFGQLKGTLYNTTFRRVPLTGNVASQKSSLEGSRVKTAPEFANTRKTNAEFQNSAYSADALLATILGVPPFHRNSRQYQHLIRLLMKTVIPSDVSNPWGSRTTEDADTELLDGWQYNEDAPLNTIVNFPYSTTLDRTTGALTVDIPSFVPSSLLVANPAATHFRIVMVAAEVDFGSFTSVVDTQQTAILPYDSNATTLISQNLAFTAGSTLPVFGVLAIAFYKLVSGNYDLLDNKAYNTNGIILADNV